MKITANPRAGHHHLHTPPQDLGGNGDLNHHKHRMRLSLIGTPAFSKSQFFDCSPVGITSTRHVTTAKVVPTVQCCMSLGEPQKRCHTGIPTHSTGRKKAQADSKTHLQSRGQTHRRTSTPEGRLSQEPHGFSERRILPISTLPLNLRRKHLTSKQ